MKIKHGFKGEHFLIVPYQAVSAMMKNQLAGDVCVHSLGHFANAAYHYINRPQGCAEYIFIYCISGCGWVNFNEKRCVLTENQFIIIPPGTPHSYGADDLAPWSIYWIHFTGEKAGLFAHGFERPVTVSPSENSRIEDRLNLFEEMYAVLNNGFSHEHLCYANLCLSHFLGTFKFLTQYHSVKRKAEFSCNAVHRVIYFMHENISNRITIKGFANYLGYSESYFYRTFIRETGYPPIEYFNRLKVEKACDYLLHSKLKIIQIANILGFHDQYYFSRLFSRITGISPIKYRRSNAEEITEINSRFKEGSADRL